MLAAIAARVAASDGAELYRVGEVGEVACPEGFAHIPDETLCRAAATQLGMEFALSYSVAGYPRGCVWADSLVYFNTHATGGQHDATKLICQVGTAPVPDDAEDDGVGSCPAGQASCGDAPINATDCLLRGFDTERLVCSTCRLLAERLTEAGGAKGMADDCLACCREGAIAERFESAKLIADASAQEKDQDLHDFIKRKAPLFSRLEVVYQEGAKPAIELERSDQPDRIVRADVAGWKSEHLFQFASERLEKDDAAEAAKAADSKPEGAWTAEIQSCSG